MDNQIVKNILELATFSESCMLLIFGIMTISGILGGLVNYLLIENHESPVWKAVIGYCLLGIVAAFTVPLFLNMISSNLLTVAPRKPLNLFVFNGICLLFALFACRFKDNIYNKPLRRTKNISKNDAQIDPTANDYDSESTCQKVSKEKLGLVQMSESELKIIRAMTGGKHVHRSLVGLLNDPALANEKINEPLSSLMAKGFIEQKLNRENKLRLYLTPKGKQLLN